jgi:hypothetical protein
MASDCDRPLAEALNDLPCRIDSALVNLAIAEREDLEQGECFLCLLVAGDILNDRLRLTILGDDERLLLHAEVPYNLRGMSFEVADGFDLAG